MLDDDACESIGGRESSAVGAPKYCDEMRLTKPCTPKLLPAGEGSDAEPSFAGGTDICAWTRAFARLTTAARVSLADDSVQDTSGAGASVAFVLLSGRNGAKCRRASSSSKRIS